MLVYLCLYIMCETWNFSKLLSFSASILLGVLFGVIVMVLAIAIAAFVVLYCHYRQLNRKYVIMQETTENL